MSKHGSLDWLCWPRFDSPSLFAGLLDDVRGGHWSIRPLGNYRSSQRYLRDTNVLTTRFVQPGGELVLIDLMPVATEEEAARTLLPESELLRRVQCLSGSVEVEVELRPKPGYGLASFRVVHRGALGCRFESGSHAFLLRSTPGITLGASRDAATSIFRLEEGDVVDFSLSFSSEAPAHIPMLPRHADESLTRTVTFWRDFVGICSNRGVYRDELVRSLLTLKLLAFAPSGAIVAAPTTSLPERLGGDLNWDYRYCWLRDAAFTVRALLGLNYSEEAEAFVSWMLHSTRLTRPEVRVLYDVYGRLPKHERELDHLRGYAESRPVRIRNAASTQLQLDTYGEVIDSLALLVRNGGPHLDHETQSMLGDFGRFVCHNWPRPDSGIWEPRDEPRPYTHSRLMCWTALDRILELHELDLLHTLDAERFAMNRAMLGEELRKHAWNEELQSYVDVCGGDRVDASLLLLAWHGFERPDSARMRSTAQLIRERLGCGPGLLYRYERSLVDREGAFGICSFWMAEYLARGGGTLEEAQSWFEAMLRYANELGLFAEEIDPRTGEALGNFPQAFTHVGLIGAALALEERAAREGVRLTRAAPSEEEVRT